MAKTFEKTYTIYLNTRKQLNRASHTVNILYSTVCTFQLMVYISIFEPGFFLQLDGTALI